MSDPSSALVTPVASAPIPDFVDYMLHFPDLLSPSTWLLWVIDQVCGVNPVDWVTENFSGDWEKMSTASSALEHLATYHEQYAAEISAAQGTFTAEWNGNASTAAATYFSSLAEDVAGQGVALRGMAGDVDAVAQGMKSFQDMLGSAIGLMLDYAIAAAVSAAAATASSWTIVGGIIGGGATAYSIARAVDAWMDAIKVHGYAVTAVDGLLGLTAGFLGAVHGFEGHPLPAGAYDNTNVP